VLPTQSESSGARDLTFRAGRFVSHPTGYKAFIPAPLPPDPAIEYDGELLTMLSDADRNLARLDAISAQLPNPDLFVAMYVKQEAVLSSQIEGTQSTLEDILAFEADHPTEHGARDVSEVVNYVRAMNHGLDRLHELPLSLRLIREIHAELMKGVRGQERTPGEFRTSQNWIGAQGASLNHAAFVPPPPHEVMNCLGDFESFLHRHRDDVPLLIRCGLAQAQFETIHPFLDGNGRVGRLLITFMLCEAKALSLPLLYLSIYLKAHRSEYYDRLTAIRKSGHWEAWLKFFLRGVSETALLATRTAKLILAMRQTHRELFASNLNALKLLDALMRQPYIDINRAMTILECSFVTASKTVKQLESELLLQEITGQSRNRLFRYKPYLDLFENQSLHSVATHDATGAR
jgi:Fic family protein